MERKKLRLYLLWGVLIAALTYAIWGFSSLYLQNKKDAGLIHASGRIEGTEVTVGTKVAGRLERLLVEEGESVERGALLGEISSEEIRARWERARAAISLAERNLFRQAENVQYWDHKVREAETSLEFSRRQIEDQITQAEAGLGAAAAALARAEANLDWWQKESRRLEDLFRQGMVSAQSVDHAKSSLQAAIAEVDQLHKERERAQAALRLAQNGRLQIEMREKERAAALSMRSQAKEAMEAARMEMRMAEAGAKEAQAVLEDCRIVAPISGTVMTKIAEEGEVLAAGRPILTLIDLSDIYLKVYIPEAEIGKIRLGNPARIYVDAYPNRSFQAKVTQISQQAEFTPKNVETKQERVNLVFAVKLTADHPEGLLKPGMPADGIIKCGDGSSWPK
ncbi:MAG: efflux RND transporter periplasmic adaptor subunit [candidate division NC10 bacterium]|nr:efflux RND transporter periplasmic adaptor subunit [candidate division NC10 bacterium]